MPDDQVQAFVANSNSLTESGRMGDSSRLLLYGEDRLLLYTRARILAQQSFTVDIATSRAQFAYLLQSDRPYSLVAICHSAPNEIRPTLHAQAAAAGVPVYQMEFMVLPQELIRKVRAALGN